MTTLSASNALGWSVEEWIRFHRNATPQASIDLLLDLLGNQRVAPEDPAWISVASRELLEQQWQVLQTRANKESLPLYGVPVAVKDNIDAKGFATTAACPDFSYFPVRDSKAVELLKHAGAIVIGKTNLDQFATGLVGTRSPYGKTSCVFSDKHVSGGSSAGSASVVARGIVPIALGTDTAGSGRVPAALNNIVGLKPTRGIFSCSGVVPACKSLDCVSVFTLNLSDAERCLKLLSVPDFENDEYSREFPSNPLQKFNKDLKIAVPKNVPWYGETQNPKIFSKAVEILHQIGANVVQVDFEPLLELARCLYEGPWVAERYAAMSEFLNSNPSKESLDPVVTNIIKGAERFSASDFFKFEYKRQSILKKVDQLMKDIDVLCVPTCPLNPTFEEVAAEPVLVNSRQGTWTNFVNLADFSALAIPVGFRADGLPNGVTLIARKFTDYALLDLAKKFLSTLYPDGRRPCGIFPNKYVELADDNLKGPEIDTNESIVVAVVGAHLKGLPLHWQLEKVNATYVSSPVTASNYRLYALPKNGPVLKPGLRRVDDGTGAPIQLETYSIPLDKFGQFMAMIPAPLGIGSVELDDGTWVKSFICEEYGYLSKGTTDITEFGGFKPYVESLVEKNGNIKTFDSVLIANRGEIAVRIIKTLKKMGIKTISIYSDVDKYSQHVQDADISVPLGGTSAAETYLHEDKIISIAKKHGANAIIPGYGFLSESAGFVDRCDREGIVFIGPTSNTIRKLGLKHSAREVAKESGVPLVPGSSLIKNAEDAIDFAKKIGYPVMVKSTAGGGGIGLQKVDNEQDISRVFESVQHQGASYFGDSGVFLEKYIENSRHVEIQIMGDGKGNAIALGERDCSLQRRNQKIVEETPAPNLPETTRLKMRQCAESLGKHLSYRGAGTVEYIYDGVRDEFYFLEVNTRLQVEHPITEMVTGLDLVEWMVKISAGQAPDFDMSKINIEGASIEVRLYAENPLKDFRPSPGELVHVEFPKDCRVDTWVKKGTTVSAEYDPTLAKIIVHGKDRNDAIIKMLKALDETRVYGCVTNLDYLKSIVGSVDFKEANFSTNYLNGFVYTPPAIEILDAGASTTIQDYPGRVNYWRIGVPPCGPMDHYSFRLANRIVGNHSKTPGLEITLKGPTIITHTDVVVAVTGAKVDITVDGKYVSQFEPITLKKGSKLSVGKVSGGTRAYLAIRGGVDIPKYLGSFSTFTLGKLGGYNGRPLRLGDVLFLPRSFSEDEIPAPCYPIEVAPEIIRPKMAIDGHWQIGVTCGPHGAPDIYQKESVQEFFATSWKVHYNSNRFGVRLSGPKPKWARKDGGEGGLHPSNTHDYVYSLGAINFTGDDPVIITCDGPSLGGFVCEAVVVEAELWKVGQVKPGDTIQFIPIDYDMARELKETQDLAITHLETKKGIQLEDVSYQSAITNPVLYTHGKGKDFTPKVVYRQAGDRYILIEYGEEVIEFNLCYRIKCLIDMVERKQTAGIVEMSQGVRSVLVEFDGYQISQSELLKTLVAYENELPFDKNWKVNSRLFRLPMAFEDSKTLESVSRYQETIRSSAPWLPNNVDFIAQINNMTHEDVQEMIYTARFMVLGVGDVFLGSPCALPLDPRHRLLGTKYNPSRTYTERGLVGIGGMYMCIYAADSPGGYQLVGRTIPIWDKLMLHLPNGEPWLLNPFDQVEFYTVSEEQIDKYTEDWDNGTYQVEVKDIVFDHSDYLKWVQDNIDSIQDFQENQKGEKFDEFVKLIQVSNNELLNSEVSAPEVIEELPENQEFIFSEYAGRFWKPIVEEGKNVKEGQGVLIIEAMKTEMIVSSNKNGKIVKILHGNGDMIDAGDAVAIIEFA
ncbi:hypothetical protein RNJ44_00116 [Nakaseomyces bracarensis]|uniref:Urea amidolyase n=1 Tax=Nakaseomyces bracarensis TaxID=273131 RepID=A0ABR4P179_9SACH